MAKETKFLKEDIIKSNKFKEHNKDILNCILEDNQEYTIKEIEKLYKSFLNKEVN